MTNAVWAGKRIDWFTFWVFGFESFITWQPHKLNLCSLKALSWIWLPLTTTAHHPWTTSPIMHCTHTFHYTNRTAVTIHSSTLIVSPHLHLIHTHTYKQLTSLHSPRSLVLPRLTFWVFPLFSDSLCLPGLPIYSDRLLPALLTLPACWYLLCLLPARPLHCPCCWFCLAFIIPVTAFDPCLFDLLSEIKLLLDLTSLPHHYRPIHNGTYIGARYSPAFFNAFFVFTPKLFLLTMSRVNMQIHSLTLDGA